MVEFWIIITILCLLTVTGGSVLAIRRFYRSFDNSRQEREAWQQAQEGRQRTWEVRQGKHILDAEKKLADQLKDARREWRNWNFQIRQDHQEWRDTVDIEKALARLPHIEQIELAPQTTAGERVQPKDWRPPTFYKADLRGRDLSYRYMVRTDLREVQLMEANLYMADLTGVSLAGADLQQANLIGANLSGADLRGANLSGANLMVADLHNTVLHGANLTGARNLTPEQLQTAIYDSTTLIDSAIDITLPRIPRVATTASKLLSTTSVSEPGSDENTNTPGEHAVSASLADAEQAAENETPITEISAATDESTVLPTETSVNGPEELAAQTNRVSAPTTEQSTDTSILSEENQEVLPENPMSTSDTNKKKNTNKKRSNRSKQSAISTKTFSSTLEETSADDVDTSREMLPTQEVEESEEEEIFPHKIIQWPTRAPKTSPLLNSNEQNSNDRAQKKRGNNLNEASDNPKNQRVQAN